MARAVVKSSLLILLLAIPVLAGCDGSKSVTVQRVLPTSTTSPPTGSSTSPAISIEPVGLGSNIEQWEAVHGLPGGKKSMHGAFYENERYFVYTTFNRGPIEKMWVIFGDSNPVSVEDAEFTSKQFIPKDAKLLRSYKSVGEGRDSTSTVSVYNSASLATVINALPEPGLGYDPDRWGCAAPGTFQVTFSSHSNLQDKVTALLIYLGEDLGEEQE